MKNEKQVSKLDTVIAKVSEFGGKLGNQRHFSSIRDAFSTFLPFMIVGSFGILINSVFIASDGLLATAISS